MKVLWIFIRDPGAKDFFDLLAGRPLGPPCAEIDQLAEKFDGQILKLQGGGIRLGMLGLPILPHGNHELFPQGTTFLLRFFFESIQGEIEAFSADRLFSSKSTHRIQTG